MTGDTLAESAARLAGAPFRLHGRDPATGLDCVGLLAAALGESMSARELPNFYALRARYLPDVAEVAAACGFVAASLPVLAGDVTMVRIGPCQFHLVIALAEDRFVHAHAGRRRVVISELPEAWVIVGRWRLAAEI